MLQNQKTEVTRTLKDPDSVKILSKAYHAVSIRTWKILARRGLNNIPELY